MTNVQPFTTSLKTLCRSALRELAMVAIGLSIASLLGVIPASAQGLCESITSTASDKMVYGILSPSVETQLQELQQGSGDVNPTFFTGVENNDLAPPAGDEHWLMNSVSVALQVLGIAIGGPIILMSFLQMACGQQDALKKLLVGVGSAGGGFIASGSFSWLISCVS